MKLFYAALMLLMSVLGFSQSDDNVLIPRASKSPTIDGVMEAIWDEVPAETIAQKFQDEEPTIAGYWKALWDNDALYVLVNVKDDDFWPAYESGGNWWEYDQVEIYLDINEVLDDDMGPNNKGTGHYQAVPRFLDGMSGTVQTLEASNYRPGGTACYVVNGADYVFEYALDYTSFVNKDGKTMSKDDFFALTSIGFDVTLVDQDEGKTTARQRKVWYNDGVVDENYINMNDAGTIQLVEELPKEIVAGVSGAVNFSVFPNPAQNQLTIDFGKESGENSTVSIYDLGGNLMLKVAKSIGASRKQTIDLSALKEGLYFVKVTRGSLNYTEKLLIQR